MEQGVEFNVIILTDNLMLHLHLSIFNKGHFQIQDTLLNLHKCKTLHNFFQIRVAIFTFSDLFMTIFETFSDSVGFMEIFTDFQTYIQDSLLFVKTKAGAKGGTPSLFMKLDF